MNLWITLPAAFLLDLLLGDPTWLPHPIRWMGKALSAAEPRFRKLPVNPVVGGVLFSVFLIGAVWGVTCLILFAAEALHPVLNILAETLLLYYAIAIRSLESSAMAVYRALEQDDLSVARQRVARIVGRDTASLTKTGVASAAVETVAENFVDGIISPLFYAVIGGAPLAMAFKMVNTLDSMVGYRNDVYRDFGKAAARIDDAANYLPARLAIPVIAAAAQIRYGTGRGALQTAVSEGKHHTSPNAGYPEAAFSGALKVKLNGPGIYGGRRVDKPFIGLGFKRPGTIHIRRACDLLVLSAAVGFGLSWAVALLTRWG
jgi:adenosylcobinamide-phosphate synthase